MHRSLKVLINAQLTPGGNVGGVEQFLGGLVYVLGRLSDGDEEYTLITRPESPDWLKPFMGPNQRSVATPLPQARRGPADTAKRLLGPLRRPLGELRLAACRFLSGEPMRQPVPQSNGFYESLGGDIIHFPYWEFTRCRLPSVFNLWDLMQLHYPQFWPKKMIADREALDRAAYQLSQAVVAPSRAVKSDMQQQYGFDAHKILVIPCAPPATLYQHVPNQASGRIREKFGLPDLFAYFPAQTFPHKNHIRLIEALRLIRDRNGIRLNVLCPGRKNGHWPVIERLINKLGLQGQVLFPGFVDLSESQAFYRIAQFVVFPSLFEGAGMPVIEAFQEGVAVTCSDIPPLREYGGDAILAFDPHSVESIAASLLHISSDQALREQLRARGQERARLFTWERTGKTYRALYRKVAGVPLSEEDRDLLSNDNVS